jgi:hypothetical protein
VSPWTGRRCGRGGGGHYAAGRAAAPAAAVLKMRIVSPTIAVAVGCVGTPVAAAPAAAPAAVLGMTSASAGTAAWATAIAPVAVLKMKVVSAGTAAWLVMAAAAGVPDLAPPPAAVRPASAVTPAGVAAAEHQGPLLLHQGLPPLQPLQLLDLPMLCHRPAYPLMAAEGMLLHLPSAPLPRQATQSCQPCFHCPQRNWYCLQVWTGNRLDLGCPPEVCWWW